MEPGKELLEGLVYKPQAKAKFCNLARHQVKSLDGVGVGWGRETDSDRHSNLLYNRVNYECKKFINTVPW